MDISGIWYNQLGSKMKLSVDNGSIEGVYHTAVGNAAGIYKLVGRTDIDDDQSQNIGFVVSWENESGSSDSVTAWSGQVQVIEGQEVLIATWLLTKETRPGANWKSTLIGKDIFKRQKDSDSEIEERQKYEACSHPL